MTDYVDTRHGSRVRVVTEGDGPVVLALHGLGGGSYFFEGCARRLAARGRISAVDLPGAGGSKVTRPPTLNSWVDDLADVLHGLDGPAIVVGHSLGTILALELWRACPAAIRAMAFVGGLPTPRLPIRQRLQRRAEIVTRDGIAGLGVQVAPGVFSAVTLGRSPETVALFARLFDEQRPEAYLQSLDILVNADASDVVGTVTVPCVAISGTDDQYAPPEDVAAFVRTLPAGTRHVLLPDVGHLPFFEAPEAFAAALGNWIEDLARG